MTEICIICESSLWLFNLIRGIHKHFCLKYYCDLIITAFATYPLNKWVTKLYITQTYVYIFEHQNIGIE